MIIAWLVDIFNVDHRSAHASHQRVDFAREHEYAAVHARRGAHRHY